MFWIYGVHGAATKGEHLKYIRYTLIYLRDLSRFEKSTVPGVELSIPAE
jgi:hypothetical protein